MSQDNRNNWEMPEPIFRKSTGELVRPKEDLGTDPEPDTLEPAAPAVGTEVADDPLAQLYAPPDSDTAEMSAAPAPPSVQVVLEPQPFISEEFTAEKIDVGPAKPKSKGSGRWLMFVIGGLVLLAVAGGFVALVYFLFFANRQNTGGF